MWLKLGRESIHSTNSRGGTYRSGAALVSIQTTRTWINANRPVRVLALNAGVDMELPSPSGYADLAAAVRAGKVSAQDLDAAVGRVLTAEFRAGPFEHPYADPAHAAKVVGRMQHSDRPGPIRASLLPANATK